MLLVIISGCRKKTVDSTSEESFEKSVMDVKASLNEQEKEEMQRKQDDKSARV